MLDAQRSASKHALANPACSAPRGADCAASIQAHPTGFWCRKQLFSLRYTASSLPPAFPGCSHPRETPAAHGTVLCLPMLVSAQPCTLMAWDNRPQSSWEGTFGDLRVPAFGTVIHGDIHRKPIARFGLISDQNPHAPTGCAHLISTSFGNVIPSHCEMKRPEEDFRSLRLNVSTGSCCCWCLQRGLP